MINPNNPRHWGRLQRAKDFSRRQMGPARKNRLEFYRQFVGRHHSDSGSLLRVPVNVTYLAPNIYLRYLASVAPAALFTTDQIGLKPLAANMQSWMNKAVRGMRLGDTFRSVVLDALVCLGCVKVGEAVDGQFEIGGVTQYLGQPFAEAVDLDDLVLDMLARRFDQMSYAGNRYRVLLDEAVENDLYDREERGKLSAMTQFGMNERGEDRLQTIGAGREFTSDTPQDYVELWDDWLPRERLVVTTAYYEHGGEAEKPLRIMDWGRDKPDFGPYFFLSYCTIPNNLLPAAPMQNLVDLADLLNRIWLKIGQQAERQKTILVVPGAAKADGDRVIHASDGEAITGDNPDRMKEVRYGGPDQANMAAALAVKDIYYGQAGNLDSLGGLSPQSGTLGQDRLLAQSSGAQMAEMQNRTRSFYRDVYRALAQWWYTNPTLTYSATRQVQGVDIPVLIPPGDRPGYGLDWEIDIDPYTMKEETPESRLNTLTQLLQTIIIPAEPRMAEAGYLLKWPVLMEAIFRYANQPELKDLFEQAPPSPEREMAREAVEESAPKPAMTTRTNVRINRPGMTRQGQSDVMQQLLAGGGQPKQAAMMGRPVG